MWVEDLSMSGAKAPGAPRTDCRPLVIPTVGGPGSARKRGFSEDEGRESPGLARGAVAHRPERRGDRRQAHRAVLTLSVFNRGGGFTAQLVNCSQDGICAETDHSIRPGTSICIRMDADCTGSRGEPPPAGFRTMGLGEARWARAVGPGPPIRYHVGIRYYPPHY